MTSLPLLILAMAGTLLVSLPRDARAVSCRPDGASCGTSRSCCSGVCTANVCKSVSTTTLTSTSTTTASTTTITSTTTTIASTTTVTSTTTTIASTTTTTPITTSTTTIPSSVPTGLTAAAVGCTQVNLAWRAPTDTTGLMGYDVYRNGSVIAQVRGATTTTYQDLVMPLAPETYTVAAVDNAGNVSAESAPASATPPACFALGVVHPPNDGCTALLARPGFVANWWDKGQSPASLQATVSSEQACGQMEVPLFWTKPDWATTSSKITAAMTTYFQQNPTVPLWQFGWEENAHGRCCTSAQLTTIAQELAAVAAARTAAGLPGARLAYQIVFGMGNAYDGTGTSITTGSSLGDLEAFFASTAPTNLDTIAVHPYAWNNFPTPETWEPQFLAMLRGYIRNSVNPAVDIVYTEGGAPVCDTSPAGCTLDEYGTPVRGQGQEENAEFMVKHHVLALAAGVTKVLWYQQGYSPDPVCTTATSSNNCGSSGAKAGCAESCFGMVNAQGPRLVAGAHGTLTGCLAGKGGWPVQASLATGVQAYDFAGPGGHCVIAWTYLAGTTEIVQPTQPSVTVTLDTLTGGRPPTNVQTTTGGAIPFTDGSTTITLTPAPVFIETD